MKAKFKARDRASASLHANRQIASGVKLKGRFEIVCRDRDGNIKWTVDETNLVVNTGLDEILANGIGAPGALFNGLKLAGTPAPTDTMASHPSWIEFTDYSSANRPAWTHAGVSGQQATNSASPSSFDITGPGDVTGAFVTDTAPKSPGNVGTLVAAVDFTNGTKNVDNGDTLDVVYTLTAADDGT